jgi:hypothetical protein
LTVGRPVQTDEKIQMVAFFNMKLHKFFIFGLSTYLVTYYLQHFLKKTDLIRQKQVIVALAGLWGLEGTPQMLLVSENLKI